MANRLEVRPHSLYAWLKKYGTESEKHLAENETQREMNQLRKELKRVTEERDLLKKAEVYFAKQSG